MLPSRPAQYYKNIGHIYNVWLKYLVEDNLQFYKKFPINNNNSKTIWRRLYTILTLI